MRACHDLARVSVPFDEANPVPSAGLLPAQGTRLARVGEEALAERPSLLFIEVGFFARALRGGRPTSRRSAESRAPPRRRRLRSRRARTAVGGQEGLHEDGTGGAVGGAVGDLADGESGVGVRYEHHFPKVPLNEVPQDVVNVVLQAHRQRMDPRARLEVGQRRRGAVPDPRATPGTGHEHERPARLRPRSS